MPFKTKKISRLPRQDSKEENVNATGIVFGNHISLANCTYSTEESFLKDFCIARFVHSTIKTTITMDLLGSIMGKMTGPPTATEKQKAERKKARELAQVTRLDTLYIMDDDFLVVWGTM